MFFLKDKGWLYAITMVAIIIFFIVVTYILDFEDPILIGILIGGCCAVFPLLLVAKDHEGF